MKMLKPTTNRKKQPFISAWPWTIQAFVLGTLQGLATRNGCTNMHANVAHHEQLLQAQNDTWKGTILFIYLFFFLWTIGTWGSWVWEERPKHVSVHPKWGRWGLSRSNSNIFRNFNWLWHWFKISVSLEDADYSPVFIAKQTIWTLGISPFHPAFRWCSPHQGPTEVANLSWNTVEPINSNEAGSSLKWFPKDPCMEYLPTLGLF